MFVGDVGRPGFLALLLAIAAMSGFGPSVTLARGPVVRAATNVFENERVDLE